VSELGPLLRSVAAKWSAALRRMLYDGVAVKMGCVLKSRTEGRGSVCGRR
jgi:hypothetical protein